MVPNLWNCRRSCLISFLIVVFTLVVKRGECADVATSLHCYQGNISHINHDKVKLGILNCSSKSVSPVAPGNDTITHCLIFKHLTGHTTQSTSTLKWKGNQYEWDFWCDTDHFCDAYNSSEVKNVTLKNMTGDLHCCRSSRCNDMRVAFPDLAMGGSHAKTLSCFSGSTVNNETKGHFVSCPVEQCLTWLLLDEDKVQYACDDRRLCAQNNLTSNCTKVTSKSGQERKLCCCSKYQCNKPDHISADAVPVHPLGPLPHGRRTQQNAVDWMFVGGIIAAVGLCFLVILGAFIIVRKYRQQRTERMSYVYSQLTADLTEQAAHDDYDIIEG